MSGIVGIVNLDGAPIERGMLLRMTQSMTCRGPDAQQIWIDHHVGLGHTMFHTTSDSWREKQPCSLDGQIWIAADARIDDRANLIEKLRAEGRFDLSSATDVELLLHAYKVWGEQCPKYLLGDFAFAIWDGARQRLFCARDPFGVRLFYYASLANCFIFSNTLNCVRMHPAILRNLNDLAIADFLLFSFNPDPATTSFADIERVLRPVRLSARHGRRLLMKVCNGYRRG